MLTETQQQQQSTSDVTLIANALATLPEVPVPETSVSEPQLERVNLLPKPSRKLPDEELPQNDGWGLLARGWCFACLALAALLGVLSLREDAQATGVSAGEASASSVVPVVRPIESYRVGDAVLADKELGEADGLLGARVERDSWRHLILSAPKKDGAGNVVGSAAVELLRPVHWLEDQGARQGASVYISVPECGIDGDARVIAIHPCPPLQPTPAGYRTVTGTFRHEATAVMDVVVEGSAEPIGTTPNHPFWSEDRQEYVRADSLKVGERLLGESGPVQVKSLSPRGSPEPVYNTNLMFSSIRTRTASASHGSTVFNDLLNFRFPSRNPM